MGFSECVPRERHIAETFGSFDFTARVVPNDMADRSTSGAPVRRIKCIAACDNCKRRKERCNSVQPCSRCVVRGVRGTCVFSPSKAREKIKAVTTRLQRPSKVAKTHAVQCGTQEHDIVDASMGVLPFEAPLHDAEPPHPEQPPVSDIPSQRDPYPTPSASGSSVTARRNPFSMIVGLLGTDKDSPVLVCHPSGFALLHNVRGMVKENLGDCDFLMDPPERNRTAQATEDSTVSGLHNIPDTRPTLAEAQYYFNRCHLATSWWLDVGSSELIASLPQWLASPLGNEDPLGPMYYLIFALGAQTCPEDRDELAERYFTLARRLAGHHTKSDESSILMIRYQCLISMYLLGDSRVNAAYTNLGVAIRAAHILGLHSTELTAIVSPSEQRLREKVWKSLRFLDMYLSASLGRPPATHDDRGTELDARSPALGICHIYEKIMSDVYSGTEVLPETLHRISEKQRIWANGLANTLLLDSVETSVHLSGTDQLNISLLHVKQSFYCSIILLTWPTFFERVERRMRRASDHSLVQERNREPELDATENCFTRACIDSAVRMIDVLECIQGDSNAPKRLPVIMSSAFVAALVLGTALFGGFDRWYPLAASVQKSIALFKKFPSDPLACRFGANIERLYGAWHTFHSRRIETERQMHTRLLSRTFGSLEGIGSGAGGELAQDRGGGNLASCWTPPLGDSDSLLWDLWSQTVDGGDMALDGHQMAASNEADASSETLLADCISGYDFGAMNMADPGSWSEVASSTNLLGFDFLEGAC